MAASKKATKAPAKTNKTLLVVESPSKAKIISKSIQGRIYGQLAAMHSCGDLLII